MSHVIAAPEFLAAAASDLTDIGSDLSAANTAAAAQTTGLLAAAEDEVSTAVAAVFSAHGQGFHALRTQAAAFHAQFVRTLNSSAGSYASTEAQAVNTLVTLFGAPAIPAVPATGSPTFSGKQSLHTKIESATLLQVPKYSSTCRPSTSSWPARTLR